MGWAEEKEKEDMFNKHCKKVALIMALSMMTSISAFAAKKEFNFKIIPKGQSAYTKANLKSDNEKYAYVTVEKADLISNDKVEYAVSNNSETADVSARATYHGKLKPYKQTLKYNSGQGIAKVNYKLRIKTYNYSVQVSGRWNS